MTLLVGLGLAVARNLPDLLIPLDLRDLLDLPDLLDLLQELRDPFQVPRDLQDISRVPPDLWGFLGPQDSQGLLGLLGILSPEFWNPLGESPLQRGLSPGLHYLQGLLRSRTESSLLPEVRSMSGSRGSVCARSCDPCNPVDTPHFLYVPTGDSGEARSPLQCGSVPSPVLSLTPPGLWSVLY